MDLSQLSLESPTLKEDLKRLLRATQLTIDKNGVKFLNRTNYHIRHSLCPSKQPLSLCRLKRRTTKRLHSNDPHLFRNFIKITKYPRK